MHDRCSGPADYRHTAIFPKLLSIFLKPDFAYIGGRKRHACDSSSQRIAGQVGGRKKRDHPQEWQVITLCVAK
jgi:hypothetical protein